MKTTQYATWVLISNASQARLFGVQSSHRPWTMLQALVHPGSRLKGLDLRTDRSGQTQESARPGNNTSMEPHVDPKEAEARTFARQIAAELDQGLAAGRFDKLVVAAPPHFLGLLRAEVGEQARRSLSLTVNKDYTQVAEYELPGLFQELLPKVHASSEPVL